MKNTNSNRTNNAKRTTRITIRFYAPECCAPRTFGQEMRELAPAFGIMVLLMGTLVGSAFAFAAIINALS
jgi:hypothetical protein